MPLRMTTRSASRGGARGDATPRGGMTDARRGNAGGNPDIVAMITRQLQYLLLTIVTQINNQGNDNDGNRENNVNENNNVKGHERGNPRDGDNNNNGNGCSYKEFLACQPKEFDGKGGEISYTRWVEKMESVIDMSNCTINQRVKYVAGSLTGKALTWWNMQIQARGRIAIVGMAWDDFKHC
ncbi:hypothetical protein Tco_1475994 [Tanacetum coccineum]